MSFLSRLTKGLATLNDFISGLSKGILSKEGANQSTIKSNALIKAPTTIYPSTGGKKHKKTPYWTPHKKPVKIKLRTRGIARFPYAWKARIKARARTEAKTGLDMVGKKRASTGFLAQIKGIRSFNIEIKRQIFGINRFISTLYVNIYGILRSRLWLGRRVTGIRRKVTGKQIITRGIKRTKTASNFAAFGIKSIQNIFKFTINGDIRGRITKYFKVHGKKDLRKILFALGLFDRVEKKR